MCDFLLSVYLEASYRLLHVYKHVFAGFNAQQQGAISLKDFAFLAKTFYKEEEDFDLLLLFTRESETVVEGTAEMGQDCFQSFCDRYQLLTEGEQAEFLARIDEEPLFRN